MRILVSYRGIPGSRGWATGDSLICAFRELGHAAIPYGNYYQTNEWLGGDMEGADLLVYLECCDSDPQYIELRELKCPKVYWEFDTAIHRQNTEQLLHLMQFDHVFMANYDEAQRFEARYLPYAADPELFPPGRCEGEGVAIIGTAFPARKKFAEEAGVDIITGKLGPDYAAAIRSLSMHVHYLDSGGKGMVVARPFETMASRVCLLAEDTPAMRRHWVPGVHYAAFSSPGDCRDALVLPSSIRQQIAAKGHESVMKHHTYRHRAEAILEVVG